MDEKCKSKGIVKGKSSLNLDDLGKCGTNRWNLEGCWFDFVHLSVLGVKGDISETLPQK